MLPQPPDHKRLALLAADVIEQVFARTSLQPDTDLAEFTLDALPRDGIGYDGFASHYRAIASASAGLAAPNMMGHMDTAPHPVAVYADALVSALNNNLLFRELSPLASQIEEHMLAELARVIGLDEKQWQGTFVSGGSLANLTALFAATGGYAAVAQRSLVRLYVAASAHASVSKSAAVLGLLPEQIIKLDGDTEGRMLASELDTALQHNATLSATQGEKLHHIVVAVAGSTIHGAMDALPSIADICERHGAWLHVDAVYGAALGFSSRHSDLLDGIERANSVVAGPQKWMYVPRLSAIVWVRGADVMAKTLTFGMDYSTAVDSSSDSGDLPLAHRGQYGLQGSRRADAVTLWLTLNFLGTDALGRAIDENIQRAQELYALLESSRVLEPTHSPELNLQCFRFSDPARHARCLSDTRLMSSLGQGTMPFVSVSRWRDEAVFRAVILSSDTRSEHFQVLLDQLTQLESESR